MNETNWDDKIGRVLKETQMEIAEKVRLRVDSTLAALPESTSMRKFITIGSLSAVLIGGILLTASVVYPSVAQALQQLPIVGSVFKFAGDIGLQQATNEGYSTTLNETVSDHNIRLGLTDVLYDGTRISVGVISELASTSDTKQSSFPRNFGDVKLYVNGEWVNSGYGYRDYEIGNGKYAGVFDFAPQEKLPDKFTLKMDVGQIGDLKGDWSFRFPVSIEKTASATKTFLPMATIQKDGVVWTAKKVTFTPSTTEVILDMTEPKTNTPVNMDYEFMLQDDKGHYLEPLGSDGSGRTNGDQFMTQQKLRFAPYQGTPSYLILQPMIKKRETKGPSPRITTPFISETPVTIKQGKAGEITAFKHRILC